MQAKDAVCGALERVMWGTGWKTKMVVGTAAVQPHGESKSWFLHWKDFLPSWHNPMRPERLSPTQLVKVNNGQ